MKTFLLYFFLLLATAAFSQTNNVANMENTADTVGRHILWDPIEIQPRFDGDINSWLMDNIKYPPTAAESRIEGRVIVQFLVKADGSITDAKVVRGVVPYLDAEALRVVNSMPKWIPARENGKDVDFKFTFPITFKLQ